MDQRNRIRILEAATAAFAEKGYRASIDDIAKRAGVARQTLYNHFERKEFLFSAVVKAATRSIIVTLEEDHGNLRQTLVRFSTVIRERILSPDGLAMFRAIVAEAPRFPQLAAACFNDGPEQVHSLLAAFLARAMEVGMLRQDDPRFAAEILLGMIESRDRWRALVQVECDALSGNDDKTERIVDCFMHAFSSSSQEAVFAAPTTNRAPKRCPSKARA